MKTSPVKEQTPLPSVQGRRWCVMSSWAGSRNSAHSTLYHRAPSALNPQGPLQWAVLVAGLACLPGMLSNQSIPGRPRRHVRTAAGLSRSRPEDHRGEWGLNPQLQRKGWRKPTALRGCDHESASLVPETVEARIPGKVV